MVSPGDVVYIAEIDGYGMVRVCKMTVETVRERDVVLVRQDQQLPRRTIVFTADLSSSPKAAIESLISTLESDERGIIADLEEVQAQIARARDLLHSEQKP